MKRDSSTNGLGTNMSAMTSSMNGNGTIMMGSR